MTALHRSSLPRLLVLTDRSVVPAGRDLIGTLREAIAAGARAVVLRERDLPTAERALLADQVQAMLAPVGGVLLLASTAPRATSLFGSVAHPDATSPFDSVASADATPPFGSAARPSAVAPFSGLHLRASDPAPARRPGLLGRSTHSLDELLRAADEGCDYVTLSPVAPTRSKPGYGPALGVAGFRDVLAAARHARSVPPVVFALGGVDEHNAASFLGTGADGVAVMGSVMGTQDPGRTVRGLLAAIGAETRDSIGQRVTPAAAVR